MLLHCYPIRPGEAVRVLAGAMDKMCADRPAYVPRRQQQLKTNPSTRVSKPGTYTRTRAELLTLLVGGDADDNDDGNDYARGNVKFLTAALRNGSKPTRRIRVGFAVVVGGNGVGGWFWGVVGRFARQTQSIN